MMNCSEARKQVDALREAGGVPPPQLEQHLAGCPDCREAYEAERFLIEAFAGAPWPNPPAAVDVARIERLVERHRSDARIGSSIARRPPIASRHTRLGAVFGALAFGSLAWWLFGALDAPSEPNPVLLQAFFATGALLWIALGSWQRQLARTASHSGAWREFGLGVAQLAVAAPLVLGAANPTVQSSLRASYGQLTLQPAQANESFFDSAVLCVRSSDGQLRLSGSSMPCRSGEFLLEDGVIALDGSTAPSAPVEYRAGSATIPAGLHYVSIDFSRPMPHAGYQVTVTAAQRGHHERGISPDSACRYLNVTAKSTSGFDIDLRNCAHPGADPVAVDMTIDWMAIESR